MLSKQPRHGSSRSFTLLEMILVLALLCTIAIFIFDGYFSVVQAGAVTTGADLVNDTLTEGRASAVAQNTTVEVRLYEVLRDSGPSPVYGALQLHWLKADGTTPAVGVAAVLPTLVAIDATAVHSPLIAANTQVATPDAGDRRLDSNTRVFHFLPDGSTDLSPATNWFLTIRAATQSDPAHFPADWASVAVDPATGRTQIYRP